VGHVCANVALYHLRVTALTVTFGSLYHDEVEINRKNVTGVLAAATLFSLVCIRLVMNHFLVQNVVESG